jgi:hypothetical protein
MALAIRAGGYELGSGSFYLFAETRQSVANANRAERMAFT